MIFRCRRCHQQHRNPFVRRNKLLHRVVVDCETTLLWCCSCCWCFLGSQNVRVFLKINSRAWEKRFCHYSHSHRISTSASRVEHCTTSKEVVRQEEWVLLLLGYFNLFASSWHSTHRHLYLQCNYASKRLRGALLRAREEAAEEDQTFKRDSVGWLLQMLSVQIAKELHFQTWLNNSPSSFSWLHRQTERFAPLALGAPFPDFFSSFIPPIFLHCGWLFNYLFIWASYFVSVNVPESPPNIVCVVVVGFTWSGRGGEERRRGIVVTRLGKLLYFRQLTISAKWFWSHHRATEHIEVGRAGGLFDAEVSLSLCKSFLQLVNPGILCCLLRQLLLLLLLLLLDSAIIFSGTFGFTMDQYFATVPDLLQ